MAKKVQLKTAQNRASVSGFLAAIENEQRRKDCKKLLKLFKETTGLKPAMWGDSIVGFGTYTYYRANGDEGEFMATGFSPRKSNLTLYIMPGYSDYGDLLAKLGPHKLGKSCLYLKNLEEIDLKVVAQLIRAGLKDLKKKHKTSF
ncbi:MAG: DUF1801 domain-containing protein [Zetaproteobacteria bacterium]|nr:DUF1801 domain-containing protein [Zetaproteobacteria bacterium]